MWNLDDQTIYMKVLEVDLPQAITWGQTGKDKLARDKIRELAARQLSKKPEGVEKWAFRITPRS